MPSEVQRIPPAPRRVSWRKVLGYRWPLLALTFTFAVYGGVLTWLFWLANSGRLDDSQRLEAGPSPRLQGVVLKAEPAPDGSARQHVEYEFWVAGHRWDGKGNVPGGSYVEGQEIAVQYLAGQPSLNRVADVPPDLRAPWFDPGDSFALLVVPGLLFGLGYLAGVFHLRRVLAHGDVGIAQVLAVRRVRWCLPESFDVRFQFKDHHALPRSGRHWVRAHSPLGQRLLTMLRHGTVDRVPVLHDRRHPQHCRLVLPEDFTPDAHPFDPAATIRL